MLLLKIAARREPSGAAAGADETGGLAPACAFRYFG